jgi:hypothetical protein
MCRNEKHLHSATKAQPVDSEAGVDATGRCFAACPSGRTGENMA